MKHRNLTGTVVKEGVADWVTTGRYSYAYHMYMYYM